VVPELELSIQHGLLISACVLLLAERHGARLLFLLKLL
jgi:hypothetical protein